MRVMKLGRLPPMIDYDLTELLKSIATFTKFDRAKVYDFVLEAMNVARRDLRDEINVRLESEIKAAQRAAESTDTVVKKFKESLNKLCDRFEKLSDEVSAFEDALDDTQSHLDDIEERLGEIDDSTYDLWIDLED